MAAGSPCRSPAPSGARDSLPVMLVSANVSERSISSVAAGVVAGLGRTLAGGDGGSAEVGRLAGAGLARELDGHWDPNLPSGPIDVIDLFSGCGGLSVGFSAVNSLFPAFRIAAAADLDPIANQTYEENFRVTPMAGDIRELIEQPVEAFAAARRPDAPLVVVGGPPCQGFSSHRRGRADSRNSLVAAFAEIAAGLEADYVVLENVPELLADVYWPHLASAIDILHQAGYNTTLAVHNAAAFAVPQERFRLLLMASRSAPARFDGFLTRDRFVTVRDAIGWLPPIDPGERIEDDPLHYTARHRSSTVELLKAVPKDGGSRPSHLGPESLRRGHARQGKPMYEDVYGRLSWDRPAVTITNYARNPASGRYAHPDQDRGLSIREASLLQSFPPSFSFSGTLDACFRQIGNSVPPRFAAYLAVQVVCSLSSEGQGEVPRHTGIDEPIGPSFSRLIPALKSGSRTV